MLRRRRNGCLSSICIGVELQKKQHALAWFISCYGPEVASRGTPPCPHAQQARIGHTGRDLHRLHLLPHSPPSNSPIRSLISTLPLRRSEKKTPLLLENLRGPSKQTIEEPFAGQFPALELPVMEKKCPTNTNSRIVGSDR